MSWAHVDWFAGTYRCAGVPVDVLEPLGAPYPEAWAPAERPMPGFDGTFVTATGARLAWREKRGTGLAEWHVVVPGSHCATVDGSVWGKLPEPDHVARLDVAVDQEPAAARWMNAEVFVAAVRGEGPLELVTRIQRKRLLLDLGQGREPWTCYLGSGQSDALVRIYDAHSTHPELEPGTVRFEAQLRNDRGTRAFARLQMEPAAVVCRSELAALMRWQVVPPGCGRRAAVVHAGWVDVVQGATGALPLSSHQAVNDTLEAKMACLAKQRGRTLRTLVACGRVEELLARVTRDRVSCPRDMRFADIVDPVPF